MEEIDLKSIEIYFFSFIETSGIKRKLPLSQVCLLLPGHLWSVALVMEIKSWAYSPPWQDKRSSDNQSLVIPFILVGLMICPPECHGLVLDGVGDR